MIMICLFFIGWSGMEEEEPHRSIKRNFFFQEKHKNNFPIFLLPPTIRKYFVCMFLACFYASSTETTIKMFKGIFLSEFLLAFLLLDVVGNNLKNIKFILRILYDSKLNLFMNSFPEKFFNFFIYRKEGWMSSELFCFGVC